MARRKSKQKRPSRSKTTNLLGIAQSVILGNAATRTLFNVNMYEFATGRVGGTSSANSSGAYFSQSQITLPELLGAGFGRTEQQFENYVTTGYGGVVSGQFGKQIMDNVRANAVEGITTLVLTPVVFKVFSKLTRKPRSEFNKLARNVGLPVSMNG